ncbi:thioredoxin-like protein [Mucor mucedo]|uniref:thioredoxin-like protein n=1 Tax=Mucor mucedo TaxID=29922 RepID=UPI0022211FEC|nr:thioredoxin-like protein [Mucor mucedo]KAI7887892.1 thioredoxin-like protein [Mucor mucedo]
MSKIISIKAVVDTVCPWCFIGKRRLEKAVGQVKQNHPEVQFQIKWLPFQLQPDFGEPEPKLQFYNKRFGEAKFTQRRPIITAAANSEGIDIKFTGVYANTFNSHRLIWWADQFGKQDQTVEEVMKLYFEINGNLADPEQLASAAEKAGLDKQKALEFLQSQQGVAEVKNLILQNALGQVSGVPHFTINNKYVVSGAQEPETLAAAFEEILKEE